MTTYVALLHSVVINQARRVAMADLRAIATGLGCLNARTLVSTGNLVFEAATQPVDAVEQALETAFVDFHGKHVDIIVRSASDFRKLLAANPYPDESRSNPDRVVARVMRAPASPDVLQIFRPVMNSAEQVCVADGDLWIAFSGKPSESKLLGLLTPKRMGGVGTMRNWNTLRRLAEMLEDRD